MPIIAKGGESKEFTPAPPGVHQGVCVDVIDKGILEVTYAGKTKQQHKISIAWQIDERRDDGKRFLVYKRYTLSLNEKATLRKDLEGWRGRAFTRDEEMGFDVENVLGVNCLLNIQHNQVADKTYANVVSIMPLVKGMAKIAANDYIREVDREPQSEQDSPSEREPGEDDRMMSADDIPF